ncbi:MAG: TonB-dependent receptor [Pseudomonadales bacterium]|nr:TonB-dependent receptor [Pseudomonadales bacterium]
MSMLRYKKRLLLLKPIEIKLRSFSAIALFVSGTVFASGALSADGASTKMRGSAARLMEEVVVTGTRKKSADERVQDIPVAMSAYNGDQLEALQVRNIESLSFSLPNVQLDSVGTVRGTANFSVRGQGINSSIPSVDPTVGVFIDGMYLGLSWGVVFDTFDLESIEVLRGPQGLLFGRNVTGGAVVVRTRQPSHEFSINAKVGTTDDADNTYAFSVTGSLVPDMLAGKLSLYARNDGGYFEDIVSGNDNFGENDTYIFRGGLTWTPTDNFSTTLTYEDGTSDGDSAVPYTPFDSKNPNVPNVRPGDFKVAIHQDSDAPVGNYNDQEWQHAILTSVLDVEFGDGSITHIYSWRELYSDNDGDLDGTNLEGFEFHTGAIVDQEQTSHELRYSGSFFDDRLDITLGGYYFEQDLGIAAYRQLDFSILNPALDLPRFTYGGTQDHETFGFFVNLDRHFTEALTVTLGLRYTFEEKSAEVAIANLSTLGDLPGFNGNVGLSGCTFKPLVCGADFIGSDDWTNLTPRIAMQYYYNDTSHVYASFSRGFRSGGYNLRNTSNTQIPGPWDEESQNSYEVGLKSEVLDGKLRVNVALFLNQIEDLIRETIFNDENFNTVQQIRNTADADVSGVELDVSWLANDNLLIYANVGYLNDEYRKVIGDLNRDKVVDGNDKNLTLPRLSDWTGSIGGNFDIPINAGLITMRLSYSHRTAGFFSDSNIDDLASHDELAAGVSFTTSDEHWKVSLYGKNLLDQVYRVTQFTLPGSVSAFAPIKKGRVIGLELTYRM